MSDEDTIRKILDDHAERASLAIYQATGVSVSGVVALAAYRDRDDQDMLERGRCKRCHEVTEQGMMATWLMPDQEDHEEA